MRYTYKIGNNDYCSAIVPNEHHNSIKPCINKLGQYEDIEEELGIDLVILFNALKNGFYTKVFCGCSENYREYKKAEFKERILHVKVISIDNFGKYFTCKVEDNLNKGLWNGIEKREKLYLKDYGITWALTKEELL